MKKIGIISVLSLVFLFFSCDKENIPDLNDLPHKTKQLIDSDNDFGFEVFQKVNAKADPDQNICVSPLSISLALAMTYNGASGDTQIAMEEALRLSGLSREEINGLYGDLVLSLISDDPKVEVEIANSIWYRNEYDILDDFIERNEVYYGAQVEALDFTNPQSKDIINGWVADQTNDKIESIVDQISPESFMFLINAIYFKGTWKHEFDKKDTDNRPFYLENGTIVNAPAMKMEDDFNTYKSEVFNAVELPYGKGNWVMYVLVPNSIFRVNDILSSLNNTSWKSYLPLFQETREVKLQLPKWKSEYETSLVQVLKDMGMGIAFTSNADFSDILPGAPLSISDVKHKTFIEVNEEGTEAAAVTSVEIELTSIHGEFFTVDRPFVYLIAEKTTGTVLFAGKIMNPAK